MHINHIILCRSSFRGCFSFTIACSMNLCMHVLFD
uniref:Uncharacterized protein n=1 Tax=Arundo donax TaxID=35708 RepID=A0A0A9C273_ARUDO